MEPKRNRGPDGNNNTKPSKRPRQEINPNEVGEVIDFNDFFPASHAEEENISEKSVIEEPESVIENLDSSPNDNIILIINRMVEQIKYLTEKMNNLQEEIANIRNSSVLKIDNSKVREEPTHFLDMFDSFQMPIGDKFILEKLEADLRSNQSFKIFFVSFTLPLFFFYFNTIALIYSSFK